jgi:hypothetical protein
LPWRDDVSFVIRIITINETKNRQYGESDVVDGHAMRNPNLPAAPFPLSKPNPSTAFMLRLMCMLVHHQLLLDLPVYQEQAMSRKVS